MCLAIPGRIVAISEKSDTATVSFGEVKKEISIALIDNVSVGDYVIVHVGYALEKLDIAEAERTLRLIAEASATLETSSKYAPSSNQRSLSM